MAEFLDVTDIVGYYGEDPTTYYMLTVEISSKKRKVVHPGGSDRRCPENKTK